MSAGSLRGRVRVLTESSNVASHRVRFNAAQPTNADGFEKTVRDQLVRRASPDAEPLGGFLDPKEYAI
jgi:hypothetical protein